MLSWTYDCLSGSNGLSDKCHGWITVLPPPSPPTFLDTCFVLQERIYKPTGKEL